MIMTQIEKAIKWFENIAEECDRLTSGNVAHLSAQIKGIARRSAEYLANSAKSSKDLQEPASEDLEKAARHYLLDEHSSPLNSIMHEADLKAEMTYHKDIENAFKAGAQYQKEQDAKKAENIDRLNALTDMEQSFKAHYNMGVRAGKKQMMQHSISGYVNCEYGTASDNRKTGTIMSDRFDLKNLRIGDKIKLIILPSDNEKE